MPNLRVLSAGKVEYTRAFAWQQQLVEQRLAGKIDDTLLLLQHPPTITLSRRTQPRDILLPPTELQRRGITVVPTNRGGLATLHAPGQLVGYAIFDLQQHGGDLHRFLRTMEQALIDAARCWNVEARTHAGRTGVWVQDRKLASIGVAVRRWISWHGFALNVSNDLSLFDAIVPCGLAGVRMTSLECEHGDALDYDAVQTQVVQTFGRRFNFERVCQENMNAPAETRNANA